MKFWCMEMSLECPVNLIGNPDCDNCDKYGKCNHCGKRNTEACKQCEAFLKNNSEPDSCERLPNVKCKLKQDGKEPSCYNCETFLSWMSGLRTGGDRK